MGVDFDIWFTHLGTNQTPWTNGDVDGSGLVDGADFDIWFTHLGVKMTLEPAQGGALGAALVASGTSQATAATDADASSVVTISSALVPAAASIIQPAVTSNPAPVTAPATHSKWTWRSPLAGQDPIKSLLVDGTDTLLSSKLKRKF